MGKTVRGKVIFIANGDNHLINFHLPFMRFLQNRGYEVFAAAVFTERGKRKFQALGVSCCHIPFSRSPFSPGNITAYCRLKELFETIHFDLIHLHTPIPAFLGRCLSRTTGQGAVLYTAHGFHFYKGAPWHHWMLYYHAEKTAERWTDGLVVINDEDYRYARRMGFVPGKNLYLVPGVGVDLNEYREDRFPNKVRQELGIPEGKLLVTCVAEFSKNKNHRLLLQAWRGLEQNLRDDVYLLLVGEGATEGPCKEMVKKNNLRHVIFLGFREDVPHILNESDIVVLTSKREGLPKCIMEAMACGKPVIATAVRGSRDLVQQGKTGYLVSPHGAGELVHALERLIRDRDSREQMGKAGLAAVVSYSLESVLKEMASIYERHLP